MRKGKSLETSGVVSAVQAVMRSSRANHVLVGVVVGTWAMAVAALAVALAVVLWILK